MKASNYIFAIIILAALPLTVFLVQRPQNTTQQAASNIACDINDDTLANQLDFSTLTDCIQNKESCTPTLKTKSDFDQNGKIDEEDFNLFQKNCKL